MANIKAGVTEGCILGQLLFLLYINDSTGNLNFNLKLFVGYISLFSTVINAAPSNSYLNEDLSKISYWVYKWKRNFNPDSTKSHEVLFSRKMFTTPYYSC